MLITFKTTNDHLFKVEVDPLDTIKVLKEKLMKDKGYEYSLDAIKLLFAGKVLNDENKLVDYKVTEASFIVIVLPRPKGCQRDILLRTPSQQKISQPPSTKESPLEELYEQDYRRQDSSMKSITDSETGRRDVNKSHRHSTASSETGAKGVRTPVPASSDVKATSPSPPYTSPVLDNNNMEKRPFQSAEPGQSPEGLSEDLKRQEVSNWLENVTPDQPPIGDELADPGVETIVAMGFELEKAEAALAKCSYNVQSAIDYLLTDRPQVQEQELRTPAFVPMASVVPYRRHDGSQRLPRTDEIDEVLELFRKDEKFQNLRILCHAHPDTLSSALEGYKSEHGDLDWVFEAFEERIVELLTEPVEAWNQYSSAISMETATHDPEMFFDPLNPDPADEKSELQSEVLNEDVMMSVEKFGLEIHEKDSDPGRLLGRVDEVLDPGLRSDARLPSDGDDVARSEFAPEDAERDRIDDEEEEKLSKDLIAAILMQEEQEQEQEEEDEKFKDANNSSSSEGVPGPEPSASGVDVGLLNRNRGRPKTLEELGYVRVTVEEKQAIDRLKSLGFSEDRVVQIFLACDKNEELAANILLDK